jgi:L-fuculose-phosphate aldolase/L-ribulose-5-phosphate 4-epimerase
VAIGATMPETYINVVYVEDIAKIYHLAKCIGEPMEIKL